MVELSLVLFFYKSITLFDKTGDVSIQLADVMGYLMLPALLDTILNEAIGSDEEDESFVEKYEKQVIAYLLSTVPDIR